MAPRAARRGLPERDRPAAPLALAQRLAVLGARVERVRGSRRWTIRARASPTCGSGSRRAKPLSPRSMRRPKIRTAASARSAGGRSGAARVRPRVVRDPLSHFVAGFAELCWRLRGELGAKTSTRRSRASSSSRSSRRAAAARVAGVAAAAVLSAPRSSGRRAADREALPDPGRLPRLRRAARADRRRLGRGDGAHRRARPAGCEARAVRDALQGPRPVRRAGRPAGRARGAARCSRARRRCGAACVSCCAWTTSGWGVQLLVREVCR